MRTFREYSDLSDKQKIVYVKRGVVMGVCAFIPFVLVLGIFAVILDSYQPEHDVEQTTLPIINATSLEEDIQSPSEVDIRIIGLMFLFLGALYGIVHIGTELGYYVSDKLELYTDMNLDGIEKHYNKVKDVIEKQKKGSQSFTDVGVNQ